MPSGLIMIRNAQKKLTCERRGNTKPVILRDAWREKKCADVLAMRIGVGPEADSKSKAHVGRTFCADILAEEQQPARRLIVEESTWNDGTTNHLGQNHHLRPLATMLAWRL